MNKWNYHKLSTPTKRCELGVLRNMNPVNGGVIWSSRLKWEVRTNLDCWRLQCGYRSQNVGWNLEELKLSVYIRDGECRPNWNQFILNWEFHWISYRIRQSYNFICYAWKHLVRLKNKWLLILKTFVLFTKHRKAVCNKINH